MKCGLVLRLGDSADVLMDIIGVEKGDAADNLKWEKKLG